MGNSLNDGLNKPDQLDDAAIQKAEIGSYAIQSVNISGAQVTAPKHALMATGSPGAYGNTLRFGESTLDSGSEVWIKFNPTFSGAPKVVASYNDGTVGDVSVASGTEGVGSAQVVGETASKTFSWIAVGSG